MNQPLGTAASVAESSAPRFPSGEAPAVDAPEAGCRNAANVAQVAAAGLAASAEMSDRFAARAVADRAALRDNGLAIGRSDDPVPAAGRAAARRIVVAAAQADNYAAAPDSSFAPGVDNFSLAAIHNSAAAVIDSCAGQNSCVRAGAGNGAGLEAASVANGWVPAGKAAAGNRCDDSARGMAPQPKPAS